MPRERSDEAMLWDMFMFGSEVQRFIAGKTYSEYEQDLLLRRAVERCIEIVGEAARHVSEDFKATHPEIPWRLIIAQRHVMAHDYGEIRHEKLWRVATIHLPALIMQIQPLIPPIDDPSLQED